MFDNMTPNQRLMSAVLLSVIFFIGYTAIFPPKKQDALEANATVKAATQEQTSSQPQTTTTTSSNPAGHEISKQDKMVSSESSNILTVSNDEFILKLDTLGRIASMELLQEKFNDADGNHAQIIPVDGVKPLYIRFLDEALNKEAVQTPYVSSVSNIKLQGDAQKVTLTQKLSALTVTKDITFYADGHYDIDVRLSEDKRYYIYLGQRPQLTENMMTVHGAMVYTGDDLVTIIEDGEAEGRKTFNDVKLISAFDQYSATIMYGFSKDTNIIVERDRDDNPVVYFDALQNMSFNGYIGQKEFKTLKNIDPMLTNAIEYGWFTFAAKPLFSLLSWLHGIFGNWGWAIIGLTILVRIVLYPLTYKGMVSMAKLKEIAPQVKEIQAKYKGDPQRMNAAVMDFYKKKGANPLGGCLPMLLQIPVFFAIYRVLLNAVELQGAEWALWIDDLSRMDPTFILPVLMGASMYYQQKLTPTNFTDPLQEKVMKFLPVIFTVFFVTFPSGLVLYWFVNNLFSIAQQFIVNQQMANAKDAQIAAHKSKGKEKMIKIEALTLEEAYSQAATKLECSVTELKIEVVQVPSKGLLGLFKKPAVIVAAIDTQKTSAKPQETPKETPKPKETKKQESESHNVYNDTIMPESFVSTQEEEYYDEDDYDDDEIDEETYEEIINEAIEDEVEHVEIQEIVAEVKEDINKLFENICFDIDEISVSAYDENTLLIEFTGTDAALLIGKEGYRYKALSYMIFNWINSKYQVGLRLEIAEFLKNQEESVVRYLESVHENVDRDGRAQTKILDGVLVQIALKELRSSYPDKYVAIRTTRDGLKYIIINDYHNN